MGFLRDIVVRIIDDCSIDHEERLDLAVAIERVLPKEQRLYAKEKRREAETLRPPPATQAQMKYLQSLGGSVHDGMTKAEASAELARLIGSRKSVSKQRLAERERKPG